MFYFCFSYAWAGGGRRVIRVDVSIDGGESWIPARLKEGANQSPGRAWAWVLWEVEIHIPKDIVAAVKKGSTKTIELCCKAVDESFNTQPESPAPIWYVILSSLMKTYICRNVRGILNNSWDRIVLDLIPEEVE